MPTKYTDRLNLPTIGTTDICFATVNGLKIAQGYERVLFVTPAKNLTYKKPFVEFRPEQIDQNNIFMPDSQKWRKNNKRSPYVEYRSKDYTNIKIMHWKNDEIINDLKAGMYYISPFDLVSDKLPILIAPLSRRKRTN